MFKIIIPLLLGGQILMADFIGVEVSAGNFYSKSEGHFSDSDDSVDIVRNLNWKLSANREFSAQVEHPIPIIPNVKIDSLTVNQGGSGELTKDITFAGLNFTAKESVISSFSLEMTDATLYYEFLDNWISLDAGITGRKIDMNLILNTERHGDVTKDLELLLPMGYLKGEFEFPTTNLSTYGIIKYLGNGDEYISDTTIGLKYIYQVVGVEVGYRVINIKGNIDDTNVDVNFEGIYSNLILSF